MTRLLIVDDEASLLEFLGLLFREEGYEVTTERAGTAALERLRQESFDLVLCDVMMPDLNGLDLLRELRASDPRTAVIMMTAYSSTRSAIEAMKLGAIDYVAKPFDVEELKVVVQKAVEKTALVDENVYLRR
jgi:DNA-binding NtrC family response regulator